MRDLKRANAKLPAYKLLAEAGFRVFTPMTSKVVEKGGKKSRVHVPFVQDLLFVYSEEKTLDRIVNRTDTLQYRYMKGAAYRTPMTVPVNDMERFITAVTSVKTPQYFTPDELTGAMYGKTVRIIGGVFNEYEGQLLSVKGMRKKRLIVELHGLIAAAVEVEPEYVQLIC